MSLASVYIGTRFVHFVSLYVLLGTGIYVECLTPRAARGWSRARSEALLRACALAACVCAFLLLGLEAGQMGSGWPDVHDPSTWRAVLGTAYGRVWRWQLGFSVAAAVCALAGARPWRRPALLWLAAAMLGCMAFVGHAASHTGEQAVLAGAVQLAHLYAGAYWLGGLPVLWLTLEGLNDGRRAAVVHTHVRYSWAGHVAVALVIASGAVNTGLVLGTWPWHWASLYQLLLSLKIALVALMALAAVVNRYVLVPRMRLDSAAAARWFGRLVLTEITLGLLVLALVSWFATLEPA
ncbi:copper homeostasis membrane protein CopD [Candidimonas nitroreducens]|uniref:Copper resistance protein CopD n=1 Tax=Candidimonas nitroreducens TaxID=683354 RepID=A0A225M3S2_9BURK|nr:copper homeostasis membrane protein CopD [Candidimonas nitroreducens]OWT54780.1 copper resistance protein CopD [Candidimonas nitroreducens]